jgi:outer membrane protein OmpA-like peptidoglycan-associated protein
MRKEKFAAVALVAAAVALGAQEPPPTPLPAPARAVPVQVSGGAILSFRAHGKTKVELVGTERAPGAFGEVEIENQDGFVEIKIGRGKIQGLRSASDWGSDYLTYVVWAVPVSGAAMNVGELVLRDGRSEELRTTAPYQAFWLLVTAEPDFAVHEPSLYPVMASRNQEQTRTGNKAMPLPGALVYYTHYTDYDVSPRGQLSPGVPAALRQARHAVALASRTGYLEGSAPVGVELTVEQERARELFGRARAHLAEAEAEGQAEGDSDLLALYARTATQLAEGARALAMGIAGGGAVRRLVQEVESLRASEAQAQHDLTSLGDRFAQLEAAIDLERRRTRDLEGQLLALREGSDLLSGNLEDSRRETARLNAERNRLCDNLRHQLASLGQLTRQGGQLALSLSADALFSSGRYDLKASARESLAKLVALRLLLFSDQPVRFEGHTDMVGNENFNQWLSEQRALAVYGYFLEQQLAQSRIPDERSFLEERLKVVQRLLRMNFNTARRQATRRQQWLTTLEDAVAGKGMREPLVPEPGSSAQNRRVTLVFPQSTAGGIGSLCPAASAM